MTRLEHLALDFPFLSDVTEDENDAEDAGVWIDDRRSTVGDHAFGPISRDQDCVVGETYNRRAVMQDSLSRILTGLARAFVDDLKHLA